MSTPRKPPQRPPAPEAAEKPLPSDHDAEAGVLGCIAGGTREDMAKAYELLPDPALFNKLGHRDIYTAMVALYENGGDPCDLFVLQDELRRLGTLDDCADDFARLGTRVPNPYNVVSYATIVQRTAVNRGVIDLATKIVGIGYNDADAPVTLANVRKLWDALDSQWAPMLRRDDSPLRPLSLAELRELPRPEPLVDGWLMAGLTSIVYGDGGGGKSTLLVDMACHVAMGWEWQEHRVRPGTVVYLAAEGGSGIVGRVDAWRKEHDVTCDIERLYVIPRPARLYDAHVCDDLIAQLAALPGPLVWLIVDTISMTSGGLDENSNGDMASYWEALARVRERTGVHVTGVHHSPHAGGGRPRGASALFDNVDTAIEVLRDPDKDLTSVMCKKQRDGWKRFPPFTFTAEQVAVEGYGGLTFGVLKQPSVTSQASATGADSSPSSRLDDGDWQALAVLHDAREGLGWREWQRDSGVKLQRRIPKLSGFGFIQRTPNGNFQSTLSGARALHDHEARERYQPLPGNTSVTPGSTVTAVTQLYRAGNTVTPTGSASEAAQQAGAECRNPGHMQSWVTRPDGHGQVCLICRPYVPGVTISTSGKAG